MKTKAKSLVSAGIAASMLIGQAPSAFAATLKERPPQFVLLAYDGSYNNDVWAGSREFSRTQKQQGVDIRFTYFINPAYLIHETNNRQVVTGPWAMETDSGIKVTNVQRNVYLPPHRNEAPTTTYTGRVSDIGVGDNQADVARRIEEMALAHSEGHEIGSHAVGHFDGSKWSETQWTNEFLQFNYILDNVFSINKTQPSSINANGVNFKKDIIGFRAPVLGINSDLYKVVKKFNFKYDTSKQDSMNYWPTRNQNGIWNFPLAEIPVPGTAKLVTSMDYNFCVRDSARLASKDPDIRKLRIYSEKKKQYITPNTGECFGAVSAEQKAEVKANMLATYRNYFKNNYYGNRAPLSIGHHFSSWMSGAYYEALYEFADEVCNKPEVKCVTNKELMTYMEKLSSDDITSFKKGEFKKASQGAWSKKLTISQKPLEINAALLQSGTLVRTKLTGADKEKVSSVEMNLNGVTYNVNQIDLDKVSDLLDKESLNQIMMIGRNAMGQEILTATHYIEADSEGNLKISDKSLESRAQSGHLIEAHSEDFDKTAGH